LLDPAILFREPSPATNLLEHWSGTRLLHATPVMQNRTRHFVNPPQQIGKARRAGDTNNSHASIAKKPVNTFAICPVLRTLATEFDAPDS
jgi:hypothetical protein